MSGSDDDAISIESLTEYEQSLICMLEHIAEKAQDQITDLKETIIRCDDFIAYIQMHKD
jgi:hypothetical protein